MTITKKSPTKKAAPKTKPAAKKVAPKSKPTLKKATPVIKKVETKSSRDVTTTGSKKVETLMKEFNKNFPYLRLGIFPGSSKAQVTKGESIYGVDSTKKLSEVRTKIGAGEITFTGSRLVGNIEKEFDTIFGLYVQICYTSNDGHRYYTTGTDDHKSLSVLNKEKEALGCQKGVWK